MSNLNFLYYNQYISLPVIPHYITTCHLSLRYLCLKFFVTTIILLLTNTILIFRFSNYQYEILVVFLAFLSKISLNSYLNFFPSQVSPLFFHFTTMTIPCLFYCLRYKIFSSDTIVALFEFLLHLFSMISPKVTLPAITHSFYNSHASDNFFRSRIEVDKYHFDFY